MDEGQKCLAQYTNPNFFLDEWISEQLKLRATNKEERKRRREERRARKEKEGKAGAGPLGPAKPKRLEKVMYDPNTGEKIVVRNTSSPSVSGPSSATNSSS